MLEDDLNRAIALDKSGKKIEAREILNQIIKDDPKNDRAWLWLADTYPDNPNRILVLEGLLRNIPDNQIARKGLATLQAEEATSEEMEDEEPPEEAVSDVPKGTCINDFIPVELSLDKDELEIIMLCADKCINIIHKRFPEGGIDIEGKMKMLNSLVSIKEKIPDSVDTINIAFSNAEMKSDIYEFQSEIFDMQQNPLWRPPVKEDDVDKWLGDREIEVLSRVLTRIDTSINLYDLHEEEAVKYAENGIEPTRCILHQHISRYEIYYLVVALAQVLFESDHYELGKKDSEDKAKQECEKYAQDHGLEIDWSVLVKVYDFSNVSTDS